MHAWMYACMHMYDVYVYIYMVIHRTGYLFSQPYCLNADACQFLCTKHYSAKFPHYEGFDLSQAAVPF